jgi:hypothetical protein
MMVVGQSMLMFSTKSCARQDAAYYYESFVCMLLVLLHTIKGLRRGRHLQGPVDELQQLSFRIP